MNPHIVEDTHSPLGIKGGRDEATFAGSSESSAQMSTELGARSGKSRVKGRAPSPRKVDLFTNPPSF